MKYFGIGLSKTGTMSLLKAFEILEFSGKHYLTEAEYRDLDQWDFCDDMPISWRYKELDRKYPGSKFIYTVRDLDAWLWSCQRYWAGRWDLPGHNWDEYRMELYGRLDFNREVFRSVYEHHRAEVAEYFACRPGDLLVMNICAGDGWGKLCPFVGRSVPDVVVCRPPEYRPECFDHSLHNHILLSEKKMIQFPHENKTTG